MADPIPSLEELAAAHGVDLEFLRKFQTGVASSNDAQVKWRAWAQPLIAQAQSIEALVRAHPKQEIHPLDRPGLVILERSQLGEDLQLFIDVPGCPRLSLQFDPFEGVSLCGDVVAQSPDGKISTSTQVIAHLDHSWSHQPSVLQENWPTPFEQVERTLSCVHAALSSNAPLGGTQDWATALREHLARPPDPVETAARWAHWVQTWGTPEMVRSFHVVQGLFDSAQDKDAWRAHLLDQWSPEPVVSPVDTLDASGIALFGDIVP